MRVAFDSKIITRERKSMFKNMFVLLASLVLVYGGADQKPRYAIQDLGPEDLLYVDAWDMNNHGQIVGQLVLDAQEFPELTFLYSDGAIQFLELGGTHSSALGINDNGIIVGYVIREGKTQSSPFAYSGGSISYLNVGIAKGGGANAINLQGEIAGYLNYGDYNRACIFDSGKVQELETLGGRDSIAYDINDDGDVVGISETASKSQGHAFLYSDGSMKDLGTLGGERSLAMAINNKRQVVGSAYTEKQVEHAFLYSDGVMTDIYKIRGFGNVAYDINDSGQVVGYSDPAFEIHLQGYPQGMVGRAFLYENGVVYDLDELIDPASGWDTWSARTINNKGQIAGFGGRNGKTHFFLMTPVDGNVLDVIQKQPAKPVYGNCPVKEDGKDSLIVVTHGAIPSWEEVESSVGWIDSMTNVLTTYLAQNNLKNWQVHAHRWAEKAKFSLNPQRADFTPQASLNAASDEGGELGKCLALQKWSHIHLIGHSAGARLIQSVADEVGSNSTTIHCTFLDPFVGIRLEQTSKYGGNTYWSEHYYSFDYETVGGHVYRVTESPLQFAYNVDITLLNKVRDYGSFVSTGNNTYALCYKTATSHSWAVEFYQNTIIGNVSSLYDGFGFTLSKEGGGWDTAVRYKRGNGTKGSSEPLRKLGVPDQQCSSFSQVSDLQLVLNIVVSQADSVQEGSIEKYDNGFKATTQSPAWIVLSVDVTNALNFVSFEGQFQSIKQAGGLLSVYWDTNIIGSVDEQVIRPGMKHYTMVFPQATNGNHFLGFRIDRLTEIQSVVLITNLFIGANGHAKSFELRTLSDGSEGFQQYELMGQSGFNYSVEASVDMINWETMALLINTNGSVRFFDNKSTNFSQRFYRATPIY